MSAHFLFGALMTKKYTKKHSAHNERSEGAHERSRAIWHFRQLLYILYTLHMITIIMYNYNVCIM
jgi:hypothetical protein